MPRKRKSIPENEMENQPAKCVNINLQITLQMQKAEDEELPGSDSAVLITEDDEEVYQPRTSRDIGQTDQNTVEIDMTSDFDPFAEQ